MTIHHDSAATELPPGVLAASRPVANLEALTGADLAVSLGKLPNRLEDIALHKLVVSEACLIQYKRGLDLPSSVGVRLNRSLAKMREWVPRPAQRVLLVAGVLTCRRNGAALVDGRESRKDFWQVWAAAKKWCDRGGSVWPFLSRESLVLESLYVAEKHLAEYRERPVKEVWPKANFPRETDDLQKLRVVKDARLTIATLPGVGVVRANQLWDYCKKEGSCCLHMATSYDFLECGDRPKGWGRKRIGRCREFLSVPDGWELGLYPGREKL